MTSYTSTLTKIKQESVQDIFHAPSASLNSPTAASYHGASMHQSQHPAGQILQPASITGHIGQALLKPTIVDKCQAITAALADSSNIKELQYQYPIIVQKIFGFGAYQPGWQVEKMHIKTSRRDSNAILDLLHPDGPFFKNLIYKLLGEEVSFEFPFELIPEATRQKVEEGIALPELYSNKLQSGLSPTQPILVLDAFEYYFFIFSHKMVSSSTKSQEIYLEPADWLYPTLLNVYLSHFLPMSGIPQSVPYSSPKQPSASPHRGPAAVSTPRRQGMGLLKRNTPQLSRSVSMQASSSDSNLDTNVMWRSERVVQVLAEMWMGQTSLDTAPTGSSLNFNNSMTGLYAQNSYQFHELNGSSLIDLLYPSEKLPSHDLIMLVRMLVKHIHAFVHSADGNVLPSHLQNPVTVLGALKRDLLARYVEKPLYSFLKHSVEKWPLDTSFRPVLELWLSFLRPWRYASPASKSHFSLDSADASTSLDSSTFLRNWSVFVKSHSLFYTVLFQEVLARFLRIDLTSSKMSFQLSRVCRVFSLYELVTVLRDVDMSAMSVPYELRDYQSHADADVTGGDDSQLALVFQIKSLEAANFVYRPMFCEEVVQQVQLLLKEMTHCQQSVQSRLNALRDKHKAEQDGSFITFLSQSIASLVGMGQLQELSWAASGEEEKELASADKYLQQSVLELCMIFNIEAPEYDLSTAASAASDSLPDHVRRSDGSVELTALGRYQVLNKLRKFQNIESKCDSELQPVRSYESDIGVIQLYKLSCFLNKKFGEYFTKQYNKDGIAGCVARRLLLPPLKDGAGGSYPLQRYPRVSLRLLANYYFIGYCLLAYLLTSTVIGRLPAICLLVLMFVLYVVTSALRDHIRELRYK